MYCEVGNAVLNPISPSNTQCKVGMGKVLSAVVVIRDLYVIPAAKRKMNQWDGDDDWGGWWSLH